MARRSRFHQRASAARSCSRRQRRPCRRRWRAGSTTGGPSGRTMRRRGVVMSGDLADLEADGAVFELLLVDMVAAFLGFEKGLLDRVHLKKAIEMKLFAPVALEVVVAHDARQDVD